MALAVIDTLRQERITAIEKSEERGLKRGLERGVKQTKQEIVIKMLKNNMDEKTIKLMTEISQKELEKIKKQNI